jgi:transcriptional regulator with XRE-family HTH domain
VRAPYAGACGLSLAAAARMRALRRGLGWSQRRLAEESGISQGMIGALEAGRRNFALPALERAAAALRVWPADLLAGGGGEGG